MAKIKHITDKHGEVVYPISKEGAIYDDNGVLLSSKIATFITRLVDNLANYYLKSETYTKGEVDSMIGAIQGFTCIVVPELPTASAETMGAIYLVPSEDPQTQNVKDEYITIRSGVEGSYTYSWEQIGSTAIDLSGYVTTEELNTELANYTTTANLTTLLAGKQDTIADLASIRSGASLGATAYQKPNSGIPASDIAAGVIPDISGKQDVIPDLSTIRSGAAAGATAYQKPGTGIPATDMASGVQTSLGKADSAYQKPSGGIPKTDLESGVQDSLDLADSAVQADPVGSVTPPVTPSDWATAEQVEELEAEVHQLAGKFYGVFADDSDLPEGDATGYAFVGEENPYAIWNFDGEEWSDSGSVANGITGEPGVGFSSIFTPDPYDGTVIIVLSNNDTITLDLNHNHPAYYSKAVETSNPSGGFLPDVVYSLGTLSGTITFSLASPITGNVNHYFWMFNTSSTAPTITWPAGLTWADGSAPTVAASKHYEISVLNGIAYYSEV